MNQWFRRISRSTVDETINLFEWMNLREEFGGDMMDLMEEFILTFACYHIDELWERPPEKLRTRCSIMDHRRCHKNHHVSPGQDEFDRKLYLMSSIEKKGY
uniref:Uncharacterized protein n=1 Tax=Bracon brevicornis TaxID=1563983 RepID=A0A6V7JQG9_9HYME